MVVEQIAKGKPGFASVYLVKSAPGGDEKIVGMLERFPNTRTETHPWKAFKGWGESRTYLGAFYSSDGNRKAAMNSALAAIERAAA